MKVQLQGENFLSLAEVEVYGEPTPTPKNLAKGKHTRQPSNHAGHMGHSKVAVDGNTNGNWDSGSVTHTHLLQ